VRDVDHYEQPALWTAAHDAHPEHQAMRFAATLALVPADARIVLDVGAGDGRVLEFLQRGGRGQVHLALDRSRSALRQNRGRPGAQANIDALPIGGAAADVVLCCEVLEHLPPAGLSAAVQELSRVAQRAIIVTVPNREPRSRSDVDCQTCGCRYNPDRHLRSFSPDDLVGLIPSFELVTIDEAGPRHPVYPRWLRVRLEHTGLLTRPGSPTCPQCGELYGASSAARSGPQGAAPAGGLRAAAERLLPRRAHPYWLCARYERERVRG